MAYTKKDWVTGEIIQEDDLDALENAMADIHTRGDAHIADTDLHLSADERLSLNAATGSLDENNRILVSDDMGAASGLATLEADSIITISQLPLLLQSITDAGSGIIITDAERTEWTAHMVDVANPHTVTQTQVGLGNVLNVAQLALADLEEILTDNTTKVASSGGVYNFVDGEIATHAAIADAHHTNANDPTANEKGALTGSYGSPSASNKYVTETDPQYATDYIPLVQKGAVSGVAELDTNGKVPLSQINDSLIGQVEYKGLWDANANNPTLPSTPTEKGHYYIVSVAGTFESINFEIGDWIISDGTAWGKVDNTDAVSSVFGRTGNVTAQNNDYTWDQIDKSTSNIADITTRSHTSLTDIGTNTHPQIDTAISNSASHIANTSNPHGVTKAQVGLGNVTNDAQLKISQLETTITDDDSKVPSSGSVVDYAVKRTEVNWSTSNEEPLNMIPYIRDDSVMKVGRYIDFHTTGSLTGYDIRLDCKTADQLTIRGGNVVITGDATVDQLYTTSSGFGKNIKIGDDAWIGDVNLANFVRIRGVQDETMGGIVFGSAKDTNLYRAGANLLKTDDLLQCVGMDAGSQKITSVATPTNDNDAATKAYVDGRKPRAYVWLPAEAAYVPATNPADLIEVQGSTVYAGYSTLNFDDTTEEHAIWKIPMPDYDGNGISIKAHIVLGTAPTGDTNVQFNILTIGVTDAENLLSPTTVDTGTNITLSVTSSYTTSMMAEGSALVNPSNVAADDIMVLELSRDVASDTVVGDAKLVGLTIEYGRA